MDYIVFKRTGRKEYRIYIESSNFEGDLIYKGHKLGVELDLLSQLIDYRIERSTNRISVLRYDMISESVSTLDNNMWKTGSSESFDGMITESWNSLQKLMEQKFGKFRKILITAVNI